MTLTETAAQVLQGNLEMTLGHIADFSDADMLARTSPKANHAAWQLGHLVVAETMMCNVLKPGSAPELPAGFKEKFTKETAANDSASFFPNKADLIDRFSKARTATIAAVKSLGSADLDKPCPENMRSFVATNGHLVLMMPVHVGMHMGQIQAIRRKLGRPVMF